MASADLHTDEGHRRHETWLIGLLFRAAYPAHGPPPARPAALGGWRPWRSVFRDTVAPPDALSGLFNREPRRMGIHRQAEGWLSPIEAMARPCGRLRTTPAPGWAAGPRANNRRNNASQAVSPPTHCSSVSVIGTERLRGSAEGARLALAADRVRECPRRWAMPIQLQRAAWERAISSLAHDGGRRGASGRALAA